MNLHRDLYRQRFGSHTAITFCGSLSFSGRGYIFVRPTRTQEKITVNIARKRKCLESKRYRRRDLGTAFCHFLIALALGTGRISSQLQILLLLGRGAVLERPWLRNLARTNRLSFPPADVVTSVLGALSPGFRLQALALLSQDSDVG